LHKLNNIVQINNVQYTNSKANVSVFADLLKKPNADVTIKATDIPKSTKLILS